VEVKDENVQKRSPPQPPQKLEVGPEEAMRAEKLMTTYKHGLGWHTHTLIRLLKVGIRMIKKKADNIPVPFGAPLDLHGGVRLIQIERI
jgi:hypothetical protein